MIALTLAVVLPLGLLQLYKVYVGPVRFGTQLVIGIVLSVIMGIALYLTYRSSARNQP
ncbi:MAG TPA: hypothetical protein VD738_09175 [Nitrospira sp.]|nr:hypothetical protein [Nitrospira sp.]